MLKRQRNGKTLGALRIIPVLVAFCILFQTISNPFPSIAFSYPDVKGSEWFCPHLDVMTNAGIINGYADGRFYPSKTVNADQFIKMVIIATGTPYSKNAYAYWAQGFIDAAKFYGLLSGTQLQDADMRKPISRSAMAIILCNALVKYEPDSLPSKYLLSSSYISDFSKYAATNAKYAIPAAFSTGLLTGYPDGSFGGDRSMTRAEGIAVIHRLMDVSERKVNANLAAFLAQEEVVVDGVAFSYRDDVSQIGVSRDMLATGVVPFFMKSLSIISFYQDDSKKLHVSGDMPKLPDGYSWSYSINIWHKEPFSSSYGGLQGFSTISAPLSTQIPQIGNFDCILAVPNTSLIDRVVIQARISNISTQHMSVLCLFDSNAQVKLSYWDGETHDDYPLINKEFNWEQMIAW